MWRIVEDKDEQQEYNDARLLYWRHPRHPEWRIVPSASLRKGQIYACDLDYAVSLLRDGIIEYAIQVDE